MLRWTNLLPKPSSLAGEAIGGPPRSVQVTSTSSSLALHAEEEDEQEGKIIYRRRLPSGDRHRLGRAGRPQRAAQIGRADLMSSDPVSRPRAPFVTRNVSKGRYERYYKGLASACFTPCCTYSHFW